MSGNDEKIAKRIASARKDADLSQEQVAEQLNLTRAAYGHYERGRSPWTADMLFSLSRILGRSVEYFLGLDTGLPPDEDELLTAYRELGELRRAVVRGAIKGLLDNQRNE